MTRQYDESPVNYYDHWLLSDDALSASVPSKQYKYTTDILQGMPVSVFNVQEQKEGKEEQGEQKENKNANAPSLSSGLTELKSEQRADPILSQIIAALEKHTVPTNKFARKEWETKNY